MFIYQNSFNASIKRNFILVCCERERKRKKRKKENKKEKKQGQRELLVITPFSSYSEKTV